MTYRPSLSSHKLSRQRLLRWLVLGLAVAALIALAWTGSRLAVSSAAPLAQGPVQPPSARDGQAIFQENCAPCHGPTGGGDGPTAAQLPEGALVLADPALSRAATPVEWFQVTKEGRMDRFMPPWKNRLSDEQIWNAVAFALTLHSSTAEVARGEVLWGEQCAACHGDLGAGDGPQAVANNLQMPNLGDLNYAAGKSLEDWFQPTSAGVGAMPAFGATLSEEDIWAVLEYARTFTYQPLVAASLPEGEGRIAGTVTNGTPGGVVPGGLTVTLRGFQEFDELATQEAEVAEDGSFVFENLPTGDTFAYVVTTEYAGDTFASQPGSFADGETEIELPVQIWESGDTAGPIAVNLAQWFVQAHQGGLLIGELYRVTHDGDRVFTGGDEVAPGKRAVLAFNLPPEATSLVVDGGEMGDRFIRTETGVVDTQPLKPGRSQILMRYLLPYSGTRAELAHSVPYPVEQLNVLVQQGPEVESDTLVEEEPQTIGEDQYLSFAASNVPAGQEVSLTLRGLERAANATASVPGMSSSVIAQHPAVLYGLAALAFLAFAGILGVVLIRQKPAVDAPAPALAAEPAVSAVAGSLEELAAERQQLLQSIAQLDDRYAAGEMDDATYEATRTAQKRRLLLLTRRLETGAEAGTPSMDAEARAAASPDQEQAPA